VTNIISAPTWLPTDSAQNHYAAVIVCDGSIDTRWNIGAQGTDLNGLPIQATYAIVDNVANNAICTAIYGPFSFTVPPYTRRTFELPAVQNDFDVLVILGKVTVTLANYPANVPDEQNLVAVQKASQAVAYPFLLINSSRGQLSSDGNQSIVFNSSSIIDYSLTQANLNSNGYYNPVLVNRGSALVAIHPYTGDFINGLYTTVNSLVLSPGDSVTLGCDGSTWYAEGILSYDSPDFSLINVGQISAGHNFRKKPKHMELYLRCIAAEGGYSVGDEVLFSTSAGNSAAAIQSINSITADATNVYFIRGAWNGNPLLANKGTGAVFALTPSNWAATIRAWAQA